MNDIRTTITNALGGDVPSDYQHAVNTVTEALEVREQDIKDGLSEYAQTCGLGLDEIEDLFVHVGLSQPAPEPESEPVHPASVEEAVAEIVRLVNGLNERVDSMANFATQHGYRG